MSEECSELGRVLEICLRLQSYYLVTEGSMQNFRTIGQPLLGENESSPPNNS